MIKQVAYEARLRVEALEELLVAKGIIQKGEAEAHKQAVIEEHNRRHQELLREFWGRIADGDRIFYQSGTIFWEGYAMAKSASPFQTITVRIREKGTSKLKVGREYTLGADAFALKDISVQHKDGLGEWPPKWGAEQ